MRRNPDMITEYRQDLRLYRTRMSQFGLVLLAVLWLYLPLQLEDAWLSILNTVAVFAIGAIGLNLLTGYTGEVSLGQAFFMGMGAFMAAFLGNKGVPFLALLILASVFAAVLGALVGPIALRLSGNYLAIVTIGLMFLGQHLLNTLDWFSGGTTGLRTRFPMTIGPIDFNPIGAGQNKIDMFGSLYTKAQGRFWLLWIIVALVALLAKNITRTRAGRAMQAIRDRDIAAEVVGVSLLRYKVGAFALSSALAGLSGALFATLILGSIRPEQFGSSFGLVISIQFVAIIIVGGMGTIHGSILGAIIIAGLPGLLPRISSSLPFLKQGSEGGLMTVGSFNNAVFGLLVIVFLLAEPLGLAGVWGRVKAYFKSWPFSY